MDGSVGRTSRVVIGLDYGTYSTKVAVRRRGDTAAQVVCLEPRSANGYPWFVSPSLVRLKEGKLFFGGQCLPGGEAGLYRSLKVDLLPAAYPHLGSVVGSTCRLKDQEVDLFVAAYLSWALERVKSIIDRRFPDGYNPALNMAAPMTHLEDSDLKQRYLRIVRTAWESVFGERRGPAGQGVPVAELRGRFDALLRPAELIPGPEERVYEVLPETVAPLVSLQDHPDILPGLYAVLDVGAGTSEISIVRLGGDVGNERVFCPADLSMRLGGDDFGTAPNLRHLRRHVVHIQRQFHKTWERARKKDARNSRWKEIWGKTTVLLTGGAARHPRLEWRVRIRTPWPRGQPTFDGLEYDVMWYEPPAQLLRTDLLGDDQGVQRENFNLLAVAHGLSYERMLWPKWFPPSETKPLPASAKVVHDVLPHHYNAD